MCRVLFAVYILFVWEQFFNLAAVVILGHQHPLFVMSIISLVLCGSIVGRVRSLGAFLLLR